MRDLVIVDPDLVESAKKTFGRDFEDKNSTLRVIKDSNKKYSLIIKADVSHAGRKTKNNAVYIPSRMKMSAKSYFSPYKKPVLLEHTTGGENMFSSSPPASPIGRVFAAEYKDLVKIGGKNPSSLNIKDSMKMIKDLMKSGQIYDPSFGGLGAIGVSLKITDQDAIEKFLDERYLTFSVGFKPIELFNPHTGKRLEDREEDDPYPFDTVDKLSGFIVVGQKEYIELSAVSIPASDLAIVESKELIQDSFSEIDLSRMGESFKEKKENESTYLIVDGFYNLEEDISKNKKDQENIRMSHLDILNQKAKLSVKELMTEEEFEQLSGDSFCGPDRTFPVTNALYYEASLEALKDSNLSEKDKEKVKNSIERKAKKLGIQKEKDLLETLKDSSDFDLIKKSEEILSYVLQDRSIPLEEISILKDAKNSSSKELEDSLKKINDSLKEEIKEKETLLEKKDLELKKVSGVALSVLKNIKDNLKVEKDFEVGELLKEKTSEDIKKELEEVLKDSALQEKINRFVSGFSSPEGTDKVENPVAQSGQENKKSPLFSIIKDTYTKMLDESGSVAAEKYLKNSSSYITEEELQTIKDQKE